MKYAAMFASITSKNYYRMMDRLSRRTPNDLCAADCQVGQHLNDSGHSRQLIC